MEKTPEFGPQQLQLLIHERNCTEMQKRRLEQLYKQLQFDLSSCENSEQRLVLSQQMLIDHIQRLNQAVARFSQLIQQEQQTQTSTTEEL